MASDTTRFDAVALRQPRQYRELWLALAMGVSVALLILALPTAAALASSVVAAFIILALIDTRAALLALILVRSSIDLSATVPLVSGTGAADVNAAALMSVLVLAIAAAHVALNRVDVLAVPLAKPFLAFLGLALVGMLFAPDSAAAAEDWLRVAGVFGLYVLIVDLVRERQHVQWLIAVMLLSAVAPLGFGLYQYIADAGNHDTPGLNRIFGTFVHPSPYATYLVQLVPLAAVALLFTRDKLARVGLIALLPLMVFSIYATQTRVAWIGLVVVVIALMWMRARWSVLLVPLFAGALFFALPGVQERFDEARSDTGSVYWRTQQWENSLELATLPQLATVGAGLGAVDTELGNLAHNEYIRLLVETGALGLIAVAVLYWQLGRIAVRGRRTAKSPYLRALMLAFILTLVARLVIAASDNVIAFPVLEWYFWAFAAIIVVLSGAAGRDSPIEETGTDEPAGGTP